LVFWVEVKWFIIWNFDLELAEVLERLKSGDYRVDINILHSLVDNGNGRKGLRGRLEWVREKINVLRDKPPELGTLQEARRKEGQSPLGE